MEATGHLHQFCHPTIPVPTEDMEEAALEKAARRVPPPLTLPQPLTGHRQLSTMLVDLLRVVDLLPQSGMDCRPQSGPHRQWKFAVVAKERQENPEILERMVKERKGPEDLRNQLIFTGENGQDGTPGTPGDAGNDGAVSF
jgi:hypothetical protein